MTSTLYDVYKFPCNYCGLGLMVGALGVRKGVPSAFGPRGGLGYLKGKYPSESLPG